MPMGIRAKSPEQMLDELVEDVVDLTSREGGSDNAYAGLLAIRKARDEVEANCNQTAVEALREFMDVVSPNRGANGEKPKGDAEELTDAAQEIIDLLVLR
jgi:hypothetical protein